jgi:hypothetical protein
VAGLVWLVARRLGFAPGARLLAFGFSAAFGNLVLLDPEGSTPEKYALGPAVGVVLAGLTARAGAQPRWLLVAGALAGIAALFKPPDLASFAAVSVWVLAGSDNRGRDLLWLWAPCLGVLLVVGAAFTALGAGPQLLDATLGYNVGRVGFQAERIPLAALSVTWQLFRDGLALLWLPALLGTAVAGHRPAWRFLLVWLACDVAALFLGGTKFTRQYFIQLVPSCALLAALGLHALWSDAGRPWLARAWLLFSLATIGLLTSGYQAGFVVRIWNEYVAHGPTTTSVERLATMLRGLPADETVFVWGDEAQLYTLSGRRPPTRFLNTAGLALTGDPNAAARRAETCAALRRAPPAVIVLDRRADDDDPTGRLQVNPRFVPELEALLASQYTELEDAVLRPYLGGDRERVFVRTGVSLS